MVSWDGLEQLGLRVRPISVWPGPMTPGHARKQSPFHAEFGVTVSDLRRELEQLRARSPELQLAIGASDIRLDGYPKARAQASHPGVVVAFNAAVIRGAPRLTYAVDTFWGWQHNLRAVALGLEALRKVKRYGLGEGYEQYAGYRALPEVSQQTPEEARRVLALLAGLEPPADVFTGVELFRKAAKTAGADEGRLNAALNAGRVLGVVT